MPKRRRAGPGFDAVDEAEDNEVVSALSMDSIYRSLARIRWCKGAIPVPGPTISRGREEENRLEAGG